MITFYRHPDTHTEPCATHDWRPINVAPVVNPLNSTLTGELQTVEHCKHCRLFRTIVLVEAENRPLVKPQQKPR